MPDCRRIVLQVCGGNVRQVLRHPNARATFGRGYFDREFDLQERIIFDENFHLLIASGDHSFSASFEGLLQVGSSEYDLGFQSSLVVLSIRLMIPM